MKAPSSRVFVPSILRVFGNATGLTPNREVDVESLLPLIIRDAGYDPDNLTQYGMTNPVKEGWVRKGHLDPVGLDRKIRIALVRLHREVKPAQTVLFHRRKGTWGLTKAGVAKARTLLRHQSQKPTLPISPLKPVKDMIRHGIPPSIAPSLGIAQTLTALSICEKALSFLPKVNQKIIVAELCTFVGK